MNNLPLDFWQPIPIQPIPTLAALRDMVLARSTKRMPKWKFRLAEYMVVEIQPRPAMPHFKCLAIVRNDADASLLSPGKKWPTDSWSIEFFISDNWHLKTRAVAYRRDSQAPVRLRSSPHPGASLADAGEERPAPVIPVLSRAFAVNGLSAISH
jgi:hypothetical protein